jgi:PAS domain S-box-containing protein
MEVLRVLHLEDSALDAERVTAQLAESGLTCKILRVQTQSDFLQALQSDSFDFILSDYVLSDFNEPNFDGLAALKLVRSMSSEIPFLFVTGSLGEELAIETIKLGATDYVLKHRLNRLDTVVLRALRETKERSERKRAEEALRRSEETARQQLAELEAVYSAVPVGLGFLDTDLRFVRVNECLAEINGVPVSEHIGRTLSEVLPPGPNEGDTVEPLYWQVLQSRLPLVNHEAQGTTRAQPGVQRDWLLNYYPLLDRDDQVLGLNVMVQEITEHKRSEEALKNSQERLKLALEASQLGMWYWDLESDVLSWDKQCKALFGLSPETQMSYQVFLEALHPEDRERTDQAVNQSIHDQTRYNIEYRTLWLDGTVHWIAARGHCTYDDAGRAIWMMGVALDITERKRSEAALLESEERYRQRVEELDRLTHELSRTTDHLERRNSELDQFAYAVSHDLKAPLRAINNLSTWIEEDLQDKLDEETACQMALLRKRVCRMEQMIDGLLDYSRVGRMAMVPEQVVVRELLTEVIDALSPPSSFTIELSSDLPVLMTERLWLQQVFSNLIGNAIKHHDRLDGHIWVDVQEKGKFYQFAVSDDGPGIEPAYHHKVFVIFQTLQARDKTESTGIGLSLVKSIVENKGGTVQIESTQNRGTTFLFSWPK